MNRILAAVLAAGAALAGAGQAAAENWFPYYVVSEGVAFVDKDSLVFRERHVTARIQQTFPEPQRVLRFGQVFTYIKTRDMVEIDCQARVYRFLSRDLYDDTGLQQLSIAEPNDISKLRDDSPQGALAKAYCPDPR